MSKKVNIKVKSVRKPAKTETKTETKTLKRSTRSKLKRSTLKRSHNSSIKKSSIKRSIKRSSIKRSSTRKVRRNSIIKKNPIRSSDSFYMELSHPTLVFLRCEDKHTKDIFRQLRSLKWVHNTHILTGNSDYRIALYTQINNSDDFENYVSLLQKIPNVQSVAEYPTYRFATNGVKMDSKHFAAYYFLRGNADIKNVWNKFKHSKELVHISEVPGHYDFIMYAEAQNFDNLSSFWKKLSTNFNSVECSVCAKY